MNEKKDCKIIQDLLPNYIENLTTKETNQFIETHLETCKNCKKMAENMQKKLTIDVPKMDKTEVKYIKKFTHRLRIFQVILFLIVLIFVGNMGRKLFIMTNLNNLANNYVNSSNYYIKQMNYIPGQFASVNVSQIYKKNDQYKLIYGNDNIHSQVEYYKNGVLNLYHNGDYPTVELNSSREFYPFEPQNWFDGMNLLDFLKAATFSSVNTEICNGKECFRVAFHNCSRTVEGYDDIPTYEQYYEGYIVYFEKSTGLPIRSISGFTSQNTFDPTKEYGYDQVIDYKYSFNTVTDKPFEEPDISGYTPYEDFVEEISGTDES